MNSEPYPPSSTADRPAGGALSSDGEGADSGKIINDLLDESLKQATAQKNAAAQEARSWLHTVGSVLAGAAAYYLATLVAWSLCFPDSKVSLFFPPHAVL